MKKILIAEDDTKIGAALGIRLRATGYEVQIVPDGLRSYLRAMTWKPDLILMDIFMPVGSGLEVAGELERAGLAEIPIIFMTASKEKNLREKAGNLKAVGFFEKPFDSEELLTVISRALKSKRATTLSLPLKPAARVKESTSCRPKLTNQIMKKILVIDDDAKIAQGLKIRLESAGYEVSTAGDGVYGLGLAIQLKPALVITDIWMPTGGGFSVAHRLREESPEVPVLFITASRQRGLREMAKSLGAVGFIEKPYKSEELLTAVTQAITAGPPSPVTPGNARKPQSGVAGARPSRRDRRSGSPGRNKL